MTFFSKNSINKISWVLFLLLLLLFCCFFPFSCLVMYNRYAFVAFFDFITVCTLFSALSPHLRLPFGNFFFNFVHIAFFILTIKHEYPDKNIFVYLLQLHEHFYISFGRHKLCYMFCQLFSHLFRYDSLLYSDE